MKERAPTNGSISCSEARKLIEKSLYDVLTIPEQINLQGHLSDCSDCRMWSETETWLRRTVRQFFPPQEIPNALWTFFKKNSFRSL